MEGVYSLLASFAQTWGMLYFVLIFAGVLAYVAWPSNAETFARASRAPLDNRDDKDCGDDRPID